MGKLSPTQLRRLLNCIKKNPRVVVPPTAGYDSGVHKIGDMYMVVSTDPCIGVPKPWFGWLLVNYAASDVALFGAKPEFCTLELLGPPETPAETFESAMQQACNAADELSMAIVTGHTGTYNGLQQLIGVCTAYGAVSPKRLITPGNAKPGDSILCTKQMGLETAVNFALTRKAAARRLFGPENAARLSELVRWQSCVHEALQLAEIAGVHAMHDTTEGGLVSALNELAEASNLGFQADSEQIPVNPEALKLQKFFRLTDERVLAMSSTGTILAAVSPGAKEKALDVLKRNGIPVACIGSLTKTKSRILTKKGVSVPFPAVADDPYATILYGKAATASARTARS
ncbi:MAG: AIR synthase-related protein [Candidatus Bathyarchaeia archaeon]